MPAPAADPTHADTEDLVRQVLAGDTERFGVLVRRHEQEVWKVAASLLGDRAAAENLVQQTFVNAYERLEQYQPGRGDFARWLKGIARNLVREELRKSSREHHHLGHYRDYVLALYEDEDAADGQARELARAVAACRDHLAPTASQALALHYDDGLTVEEVAAAIRRTVGGTRQLLFRARLALRGCIEGRMGAPS